MKVDIVINSMIQQIDRNLQTQVLPALSFRPGELLRGKVMLSSDDRPQIRLDNGTLLDAMPAGDVMLSAGATVTLRVSGRVDGQVVMQLLEQEQSTALATTTINAGADEALAGSLLNTTPQGKAMIRAMESMNLPLREETARQALDIQAAFPGIEPEKAVFMAANKLPATQAQVDALSSLLDNGASTGGELTLLADILSAQALDTQNLQLAEEQQNTQPAAAMPQSAGQTEAAQPQTRANVPVSAAQAQRRQAGTTATGAGRAASAQASMAAEAAGPEIAPVSRNSEGFTGRQNTQTAVPPQTEDGTPSPADALPFAANTASSAGVPVNSTHVGSTGVGHAGWPIAQDENPPEANGGIPQQPDGLPASASTGNAASAPARSGPPGSANGVMQLQSLSFAALGMEAVEQYSTAIAALNDSGEAKQAAALALDAPNMSAEEFQTRLDAIVSALPQGEAAGAKDFIVKLAAGLKVYSSPDERNVSARPAGTHEGISSIVRQISELFVKIGGTDQDPGATLAKAAMEQKARIEHISSELGKAGAASSAVNRQMSRVENHVRLIDNISQYAYRQIPVQMNDKNRTVDIYVLNRKGNGKKINANNANILIALDTDNLGHIETLINVSNKSLRLRFGVERPNLVGYIGTFTSEISDAVQKAGYRLSDMHTEVTTAKTTPLTVAVAMNETAGVSGSLDIKL